MKSIVEIFEDLDEPTRIKVEEAIRNSGQNVTEETITGWLNGESRIPFVHVSGMAEALGMSNSEVYRAIRATDVPVQPPRYHSEFSDLVEESGMNFKQLAEKSDIKVTTLYTWSAGHARPMKSNAKKVAEALGVTDTEVQNCFSKWGEDTKRREEVTQEHKTSEDKRALRVYSFLKEAQEDGGEILLRENGKVKKLILR